MVGSYKVERLVRHKHFSLTWLVIDWITLRDLYLTDPVLAFVRLANTASVKQITHKEKKKEKKKNCLTETNINKDNLPLLLYSFFSSPRQRWSGHWAVVDAGIFIVIIFVFVILLCFVIFLYIYFFFIILFVFFVFFCLF